MSEFENATETNQIERLYKNIKAYIEAGAIDSEFEAFAGNHPYCDSISELNEIMECEMTYWGDSE